MRILQLIQKKQLRGAEVFACQLSKELEQNGHELLLVALLDGEADMPYAGSINVIDADLHKRFFDFRAWKKLAELIRVFDADIVQANASDTLKYAVLSQFFFRWKAKIVFRNANKMGDFILSPFTKLLNRFFLSRVQLVASVSEECRIDFLKTFKLTEIPCLTLPIGINSSAATGYPDLTVFSISKGRPVFLSVAGFVPEKNHAGLIRIFQQVHKQHPLACLLLIGEGSLKVTMQEQVKDAGLTDVVFFAGSRTDVLQVMPACTALLMPSLIEGLPAVILEAFKSKLPVIAYTVGGIPEVLTMQTGWPVKKNNEVAFAAAVTEVLCANDSLLTEKTTHAQALVMTNYLNETIASIFIKAYESILDAH